MPSQTKENYLKAIYTLERDLNKVSLSGISKMMEVSIPTVNSMVKKLQENGWVVYRKYQPLKLTAKGRKTAALIVRKHRLSEMFLSKIMGFGWEEVHDMAEELEHIKSDRMFDRMDELLGHPTVDPHGSPIPDKKGKIKSRDYFKLSEIKEGRSVRICGLNNSSTEFLRFLNSKQIKLGTEVDILKIENFDKSVNVAYGKYSTVSISHDVANRLLVEVI